MAEEVYDSDDLGEVSDGVHTFNELYEFRMLYHAHAVAGWVEQGLTVFKSWKHHDGDLCFGGGWFIVVAFTPFGQVSNHYAAEHWDLFRCPEVPQPPMFDGHTAADVLVRLRKMIEEGVV